MTTVAKVKLWGTTIGAVSFDEERRLAAFQYAPSFIESNIQVSPITMPLSAQIYSFPELSYRTYHGLPGLLADVLPDKFGNALIDNWLASKGRSPESFNAVERLCYTGQRGMGALEFEPGTGPRQSVASKLEISELVALASEILSQKSALKTKLANDRQQGMRDILRVGTSAGGARAKAIIAWNPLTDEVYSGQIPAAKGFSYWIIKFDGVKNNRDKELTDPRGYGAIEFAYSLMARAAGIQMSECRILEENGRRHFMTKRFDRTELGEKLHMQSLCAIAHYDFNQPGIYSYEQAFWVMHTLQLPNSSLEEQFRRMTFNILARNQDDHVKNIAFLMDKDGSWSLSPAYDVTYSFNPDGYFTSKHQMKMNGKQDGFVAEDFYQSAKNALVSRTRAKKIIEQVQSAVSEWNRFAKQAGVDAEKQKQIRKVFRLL